MLELLVVATFIGSLTNTINYFIIPILLILRICSLFRYNLTSTIHSVEINNMMANIKNRQYISTEMTLFQEDTLPIGYVISVKPFYIAYINISTYSVRDQEITIMILCARNVFDSLTSVNHDEIPLPVKNSDKDSDKDSAENVDKDGCRKLISVLERTSSTYESWGYNLKKVNSPRILEFEGQRAIVDDIKNLWKQAIASQKGNLTVLISGPPGTGKSQIATILAIELDGIFCEHYIPIMAGNNLNYVTRQASASVKHPLIILIDEYDDIIRAIDPSLPEKQPHIHKSVHTEVTDKSSHNKWLDRIARGLSIQNLILILTTNKPISWFNELDSSYIRTGRVDAKYTTTEKDNLMSYVQDDWRK